MTGTYRTYFYLIIYLGLTTPSVDLLWSQILTVYPEYQISVLSSPVFITCLSPGKVNWIKGGRMISSQYILHINSTTEQDGGMYKCLGVGPDNFNISASSELIVVGKSILCNLIW